ncbi:MAG: metallophosphoesterase [Candidatus Polarisedimenticolaceae bacterium]|nr:metallophosphoesterase [Candidatus Polarisedimenticolaceae bacterium]
MSDSHLDSEREILKQLERRLGRFHARQRLSIESANRPRIFGNGINFFHPENWYSIYSVMKNILRFTGFYGRGYRNTLNFELIENRVNLPALPKAFEGFTILHLTDLHADMNPPAIHALAEQVRELDYDICVLTGDYRALTHGAIERSMMGMGDLMPFLKQPIYGVLGNHDSIRMLPVLEEMGVTMLLNAHQPIELQGEQIYLAGIDDAHYYRVDNIEKASLGIPDRATTILLSHTPEVYRQAAHAEFDLMLSGHTHGGQICLPGGKPLFLDARCPRHMGVGRWRYLGMSGYTSRGAGTSIVTARLNCRPEITLHRLQRGDD